MNDSSASQLHFDFRTGRPTTISGARRFSDGDRQAGSSLNRARIRGIKEACRPAPAGESISPSRWDVLVVRKAIEWNVPLVPLSSLGFDRLTEEFPSSSILEMIGLGAEASAWLDHENKCVYKLFPLRDNASLGRRLDFSRTAEGRWEVKLADADLESTIEKLAVIHEAGGCPTEIIGVDDSGAHLIVKQPLCRPSTKFLKDREKAVDALCALPSRYSLGKEVWLFWLNDEGWAIGDLHEKNIMLDSRGAPTIIDALVSPVPPSMMAEANVRQTLEDAQHWRATGGKVVRDAFANVSDDEL